MDIYVVQTDDVALEPVVDEGAEGAAIRWLISRPEGAPNFAMRLIEVQPNGHTPFHSHDFEHEVYVLEGVCELKGPCGSWPMRPGTVALVPPGAQHNFHNTGDVLLRFICCIPLLPPPVTGP
jgi:quercetin dioxygenase-like cupin family protein